MAVTTANAPSAHAARPGTDENLFTFWPRHNAALYRALADKYTFIETGDGAAGGPPLMTPDEEARKAEREAREEHTDPLESSMILNLGPQHPATHGALRVVVQLDGETIERCLLDIGYLHRGIEKLAEGGRR